MSLPGGAKAGSGGLHGGTWGRVQAEAKIWRLDRDRSVGADGSLGVGRSLGQKSRFLVSRTEAEVELGRKELGLTCLRQLSLSFSTDVSSVASSSHSAPSAAQMCSRSTLPAKIFSSCTNIAPPPRPAPAARTREGHRGWREDQGRGRAAARSFAGRRRPAPAPVSSAARH